MTDFSISFFLKNKQNKKANIANFVYYGKTQVPVSVTVTVIESFDENRPSFLLSENRCK